MSPFEQTSALPLTVVPRTGLGQRLDRAARPLRLARRVGTLAQACVAIELERRHLAGEGAVPARRRSQRLARLAVTLSSKHALQVRREGPPPPPGAIVVANHVSYADTIVLPTLVPGSCIAKRELADWPFIGRAAARLGVVFVDRGCAFSGAAALRRAMALLAQGVSVIVFPEGTTTPGDRLLPFRRGIFGIARRLDAPVVPAAIRYDAKDACWVGGEAFLSHYARTIGGSRETGLEVWFDAPMAPRAFASPEALAQAARERIGERLAVPLTDDRSYE